MTEPNQADHPSSDLASSGSDPSPSPLNRQAIAADLDAALTWIRTSGRWTLLDRAVTLLTGRSLTQRSSAISWAVMQLPDDELELLLTGALERIGGYLGLAPAAPAPSDDERRAVGRLVELGRRAP